METRKIVLPSIPPPPGAVNALVSGFNAIASNVAVILIPVAMDIFLWLGPRLKADALLAPMMEILPDMQAQAPADQAKLFTQMLTDFHNGFNLFSVFRTFPMGIFSLMSVNISTISPLGVRSAFDVPGWLVAFACVLLLTGLGWMGGSLYFHFVSRAALKLENGPGILRTFLNGFLLSAGWMLVSIFATLPLIILLWLLSLLDGLIRTVVIVILAFPISWLFLAIFFSFYGIYAFGQNAFVSILSSIRLLRYGLPALGWFSMLVLIINQGMDMLWRVPPPESWMMGVGILGHAFVSTGLLAASFIYFRDLNIWIETVLKSIDKKNSSAAQA
jgi:hypothetical protein